MPFAFHPDEDRYESHDDILLRTKRRQRHATLSVTQYPPPWGT
jgi:hypothetical protein